MSTNKDLTATIRSLCEFYDQLTEITMEGGIQRTVILAHGWYVSALRTSQAILALESQGFGHEAAPLRRSLIEHALGLVWLSQAKEDAVSSILRSYKYASLDKMKKSTASLYPEWQDALNSVLDMDINQSDQDHYLAVKHQCERFKVPRIYIGWLYNTGLSHASYASAVAYTDGSTDQIELLREPRRAREASTKEIVGLLLLATGAMNDLIAGRPWDSLIAEIEQTLSKHVTTEPNS